MNSKTLHNAIPRSSWHICIALTLGLASILFGVILDSRPTVSIGSLFFAFYSASLGGLIIGLLPAWQRIIVPWQRIGLLMLALVVWRIAYFPFFVLAGWVATWSDWFFFTIEASFSVIYSVFLLVIICLHAIAVATAWIVLCYRRWIVVLTALPLCTLAILVSFNQPEDFSLLPDNTILRPTIIPSVTLQEGNIYLTLLQRNKYNFAQRALLHSGRILYTLIPQAPWSTTVKNIIAQGIRINPVGSSADRIYEHYIAYVGAHLCISRSTEFNGNISPKSCKE